MEYHKVIELDAPYTKRVEQVLDEWAEKAWELSHIAVALDSDGARYYTLILKWAGRGVPNS